MPARPVHVVQAWRTPTVAATAVGQARARVAAAGQRRRPAGHGAATADRRASAARRSAGSWDAPRDRRADELRHADRQPPPHVDRHAVPAGCPRSGPASPRRRAGCSASTAGRPMAFHFFLNASLPESAVERPKWKRAKPASRGVLDQFPVEHVARRGDGGTPPSRPSTCLLSYRRAGRRRPPRPARRRRRRRTCASRPGRSRAATGSSAGCRAACPGCASSRS